jgi:hypothetical protein
MGTCARTALLRGVCAWLTSLVGRLRRLRLVRLAVPFLKHRRDALLPATVTPAGPMAVPEKPAQQDQGQEDEQQREEAAREAKAEWPKEEWPAVIQMGRHARRRRCQACVAGQSLCDPKL